MSTNVKPLRPKLRPRMEVWMILQDPKKFAKLLLIQGVSHRQVAEAAGWGKSHSYVGRLIRGEARTVTPDSAARIALFLGVGIDDLFLTKASSNAGHRGQDRRAA